ncbi:MAG: 50S ribosomal protein L24 [Candidatus Atribacteria bacterium]|nr:50S ribosomal protein L24 [Candidatus Atribacteria bacterium]
MMIKKENIKVPIKKGDTVEVIHGKDKGKRGKVLTVLRTDLKAVVEGINLVKKHTRATQENPQGGIITKENPMRISNLRLVCSRCNQLTKVKRSTVSDSEYRVRICKKCSEIIDKV